MKGVAGKVAVVTGGASGIGRALCEELARQQAVVVVADLNGDEASRVAQALTLAGGRATAVAVDVARADSVQELVRATLAEHGRIDLMFNNAGILRLLLEFVQHPAFQLYIRKAATIQSTSGQALVETMAVKREDLVTRYGHLLKTPSSK